MRFLVTAFAGSALLAASAGLAAAQAPMPLPPSVADPLPKERTEPARTKKPAASRATPRNTRATAPAGGETRSLSDRIDMRSTRDLPLEDDPRVRPTMENGRAGMGMRF